MVAISCAVLSRSGRVLVSRQFVSITKSRIDGYLASFPKLIALNQSTQNNEIHHTFVETEAIRYVYQPLEGLLVLLITNKQSNILEDLDTLRLLAKLVPEYCGGINEEAVVKKQFELIFAIDEALNYGGSKENVTLQQIKTFTEMDSHEEKLQKIILESKFNEAKEEAKRKAEAIAKQKADAKKDQAISGGMNEMQMNMKSLSEAPREDERSASKVKSGIIMDYQSQSSINKKSGAGGMQLSKAKKTDEFFSSLAKEEKLSAAPLRAGQRATAQQIAAGEIKAENVKILITEKINAELEREGGVKKCEVEGEIKLSIFDPDHARIFVKTNGSLKENEGWKCRLHPKINKNMWGSNFALGLADTSKPFPVGSENAPTVIKWRKTNVDSPFTLAMNPWSEAGKTAVTAEYQAKSGLSNVIIRIPCPSHEQPEVTNVEGEWKFDPKKKEIVWRIPEITEENTTGAFEFSVPELEDEVFFPVQIDFSSSVPLSGISIDSVHQVDDESQRVSFQAETNVTVEKFTVLEQ
jgi:hypothetical protein